MQPYELFADNLIKAFCTRGQHRKAIMICRKLDVLGSAGIYGENSMARVTAVDDIGRHAAHSPGTSELAPFVYFDGVATFGIHNGAIQIELAANTILPEGKGVKIDVMITAHLRCSPVAVIGLRDTIDKALALLEQGQQQVAQPAHGSKPN